MPASKNKALQSYTPPAKPAPNWALVQQYLPLVKSVVANMSAYFPSHVDKEDLYTIALMGLIQASQNFSPDKGTPFGPFARVRIKGALMDELRRMDWMSRAQRTQVKVYQKKLEDLTQSLSRTPTQVEICEHLGLTRQAYEKINEQAKPLRVVSLDTEQVFGEATSLTQMHDIEGDIHQLNAREAFETKELRQIALQGIESLSPMAQKVLTLYYVYELRLAEIAQAMGVSESRVCQIHGKAMQAIRGYIQKQINNN
jgi:RNA polymerase sigma factor for flagellar operon FliA